MSKELAFFDADNLPSPKDEAWKYTNMRGVIPEELIEKDIRDVVVHVEKGDTLKKDLKFEGFDGFEQKIALSIIVEENAQLELNETYEGEGAYFQNITTNITLHKNARLKHAKRQFESLNSVHINNTYIQQDKSSNYSNLLMNMGGKISRSTIQNMMIGEHSECTLYGLNLLEGKQHADTSICVEHQVPNCKSEQFYRSALKDWSVGVFQSKSHVFENAQQTNARQMSNALLLSPTATMNTKPELEIYADDVECSHGATTGQLDDEQLFYLRSRGIPEEQAKDILVEAFIKEVTEKWGVKSV
ncbi:MAG: Fe-S cluster assembly protein SufD [Bdellovibrionales bacterium]